MTDVRDLISRMADELDHYRQLLMDDCRETHALAAEARAALAEPQPDVVEPSDAEIMELMPQQMHEDLATAARAMAEQAGADSTRVNGVMRIILNRHVVDLARAVLARWGRSAPQPSADGEVAKLITLLTIGGDCGGGAKISPDQCRRAAELLERLSPLQPVPVSERLPGPEDCDAEGRCWWGRPESDDWSADWTLTTQEAVDVFCAFSPRVYWLPATALPLPGEVAA